MTTPPNKISKVLAYIPARLGSVRVRAKNLRLLNNRPLLSYAIETLNQATSFSASFVNTESSEIAAVAKTWGMQAYMRAPNLATSSTKTDEIVYDFLKKNPCDAVALINPTAPFLKTETIDAAVQAFIKNPSDALFSINTIKKHCRFKDQWLNVDPTKPSPRTQDLDPISFINFIICIFDSRNAISQYEKNGNFLYSGNNFFFEIPEEESFDIDYEFEFDIAEAYMKSKENKQAPEFDKIIDSNTDYRT